ncbi:MAG TPA: radical SAM protein [Candidatus Limnocylindrales bacterium]|nr:radical SAM protein [Candidatus Limnocylindrales bacterium]
MPFPSTWSPEPDLAAYYRVYDRRFAELLPDYFVPTGGLWEIPLWVAHLTALLDEVDLDSTFIDLSRAEAVASSCVEVLCDASAPGDLILMSPLAQNFALAHAVSRRLQAAGRKCVLGGNMAPLVPPDSCHSVFRGQLDATTARRLAAIARGEQAGVVQIAPGRGLRPNRIGWAPTYRHLEGYAGQVPLIRINASHGCLFDCSFCGDAWSSQLTLVDRDALRREVDELIKRFPDCRIFYIGDKTFGQSREAVANLLAVFADRPGFRFIVQTHVMQVKPWVIDAMRQLGVAVVEMGFESADTAMLKAQNKISRGLEDYTRRIAAIRDAGMRVVLNVMGGLDEETAQSHRLTMAWQREHRELLWLCNLYNFVPYPLIPDFARLRPRIFDWDFAHWREDAPVVYRPTHLSVQESWALFKEKIATALEIAQEIT